MIKPCGLVCAAYLYALAVLCPIASVALLIALCSPPRLSSRLCHHQPVSQPRLPARLAAPAVVVRECSPRSGFGIAPSSIFSAGSVEG